MAARCILYSLDFGDVVRSKEEDPSQKGVYRLVLDAARKVAAAGAQGLVLCANTLHMFADDLEAELRLPIVHIADATAAAIRDTGLGTIGLLGTRPTMERDFYRARLARSGIETLVPGEVERDYVDKAILTEMARGVFRPEVRERFIEIMLALHAQGAQGIVLGCTEIPLLVRGADTAVPLFDTLAIHVRAAVDFALAE